MRAALFALLCALFALATPAHAQISPPIQSPIASPIRPTLGQARTPTRRVLVASDDWSTLAPGVASLSDGLVLLRASDAGYETTSGWADSIGGSDVARVAHFHGNRGLRIEASKPANELGATYAPDLSAWSLFGSITRTAVTGPDGATSATRAQAASGAAVYTGTPLSITVAGRRTLSAWVEKTGSYANLQAQFFQSASTVGVVQPGASWAQTALYDGMLSFNANTFLAVPDGRGYVAQGGIAAQAQDVALSRLQLEPGPMSSYLVGARAAEVVRDGVSSASLRGCFQIELTWAPDISAASASSWGRTELIIWWSDDRTYVAVDAARRQIRVVVDGVRSLLPGVLPDWIVGDRFTFSITNIGASAPSGTYRFNGGVVTALGTGLAVPAVRPQSTVSWFARGTSSATATSELQGVVAERRIYALGAARAPSYTFYASATGGSLAAGSLADPGTLDRALTLARAHLPAAKASVRVILRGGTYYLASTLQFTEADNGLEVVNEPGETPILSGGTEIVGWVDDGSGQGVQSATLGHATRNLWINGARATLARSAQITSGWSYNAGTGVWTAPDSTIAGYARPLDVELVGANSFKFYVEGITSAVGTSLTARLTDRTNANSQSFYPFDGAHLLWYQNARELIDGTSNTRGFWYRNAGTNAIYYKPNSGESITLAVAGRLESLVTITGSTTTLANVVFRGITFADSDWREPSTQGYATIQGPIIGTSTNADPSGNVGHIVPAMVTSTYAAPTFTGCTFTRTGGVGLALSKGTDGAQVVGCAFTDTASSAITVASAGTSADWTVTNAYDRVRNNLIRDCAFDGMSVKWHDAPAIFVGYADGTTIDHNDFGSKAIADVAVGWGWRLISTTPSDLLSNNVVSYNRVQGARVPVIGTVFMQDFGSMYFVGDHLGCQVVGNDVFSDVYDAGGIYLDSGSGCSVTGNQVRGLSATAFNVQTAAPQTVNTTVAGNYYTNPDLHPVPVDPTVVFSSNTNATSDAVILAAGLH